MSRAAAPSLNANEVSAPLAVDQVARFGRDLAAALGRVLAPGERIALAVSGGPDSMAMLALAHAAFPGRAIAATVDHGLRRAAADEAAMVADWCAANAIAHMILPLAQPIGRSAIQATARRARYDALARWALASDVRLIATAHHADDQAETFLMRAVRGAGPTGLAGIRQRRAIVLSDGPSDVPNDGPNDVPNDVLPGFPGGGLVALPDDRLATLVRPLLGWTRADLRTLAVVAGLPFVDDPSNADRTYERVRVRQMLAANPWLDAAQLARAAAHADEAATALADFSRWLWRTRRLTPTDVENFDDQIGPDGRIWLDMADLPRELRRRLVRMAIHEVRLIRGVAKPAFDDSSQIEALLDALYAGQTATQAGVMASAEAELWRFCEAPPRQSHRSPR